MGKRGKGARTGGRADGKISGGLRHRRHLHRFRAARRGERRGACRQAADDPGRPIGRAARRVRGVREGGAGYPARRPRASPMRRRSSPTPSSSARAPAPRCCAPPGSATCSNCAAMSGLRPTNCSPTRRSRWCRAHCGCRSMSASRADGSVLTAGRPAGDRRHRRAAARRKASSRWRSASCTPSPTRRNEREAARLLAAHLPGLPLSLSSDVLPQIKEFERSSTTVVNAYVKPLARRYLRRVSAGRARGRVRRAAADHAVERRHRLGRDRGRVSGTVDRIGAGRRRDRGPRISARCSDCPRCCRFDMGGTTAKACLIRDGAAAVDRRIRSRALAPLHQVERVSGRDPGGQHDRDRRRRRQHRP